MGSRARRLLIGLLALSMLAVTPVNAQAPGGQSYSQQELDQLLAPVALYPDQLLMQVLIAATYPLEVVDATRFVQQNPNLRGDALDQALAGKSWDPSVQSLAAFPSVLVMMSDRLEWMQRLGDAFLVDQQRVMDTVQGLRQRAQAAGNLQSTPQQSVITRDNEVIIEPVQPDVVYVPVYNPFFVYGPWWAPDYPPWFWYPPPIYGYPLGAAITTGIFFGAAWAIAHDHWGWVHPDWRGHRVSVDPAGNRFWNRPGRPPTIPGGNWQHEPVHRRGIAYPDAATQGRFMRVDPNAVRARRDFRGHEPGTPAPDVARPGPDAARSRPDVVRPSPDLARPTPSVVRPAPNAGAPMPQAARSPSRPAALPFDPGLSRHQTQVNAQRGQQSRQSGVPGAASGSRAGAPAPHGSGRRP